MRQDHIILQLFKTKLIARLVLRQKGSLAINLVSSALNVTSGTSISFTRDPATDKSSSFILRCVVLCIQTFFNSCLVVSGKVNDAAWD